MTKDYKTIIPKIYWSGNRKPKAFDVGDLKKLLEELPDELEIKVGFGDGCQLTVYNVGTETMQLCVEEVE